MHGRNHKPREGAGGGIAAFLFFFILSFFVPGLCTYASQETLSDQEQVTLQVEYGYDGTAKSGRYLPVRVTVENNRDMAVAGSLQIRSYESDDTIYRYDYEANIDARGTLTIKEYIPLGSRADQLYVALVNAQGQELAGQRVSLNISTDVPELFVGILCDEPETLKYLDGVGVSYSTLRTRVIAFEEEEFPQSDVGLNLLDVLVVNNYKLRNLSEEQTAAIMDWVHSGGVLILGTGERVDDTLGRFAPELLDDSYGTAEPRQVDLGEAFALDEPGAGVLTIPCVDVSLHGGDVILSSGGTALVTVAAKEQGMIAVAAFDLADIAAFCEQHTSYVDYFLSSVLGEKRIRNLAQVAYSGNSSRYWSVQSMINTGNVERLPRLLPYVVVIVLYLVLLGPGLYFFLKKRELQIYYRRGIGALSLIFAVGIYLMGSETRFETTFYTYAAIQDVTEDYVTDTTYVNVRNPYNSPYEIQLDPSYTVLPITRISRNGNGQEREFTGEETCQIVIGRKNGHLTVNGQNIAAFSPRYFQMEKKSFNTGDMGITGDVEYFEGSLSGSITNNFSFPLENTALILYGGVVYLDRMEPGETIQLDQYEMLRFPLNYSYVLAEYVTGGDHYQNTDINNTGYLTAMKRSNVLEFYLDNYMNGYTADARVIAFSAEKEDSQFLQEEDPETYGITMLTSSIGVNASRDRVLYRSVLMRTPEVVTGVYDEVTNTMSGLQPLTLEYQMGTDLAVESLTFEAVSPEFCNVEDADPLELFTGGIYFYNHETGNFDRMELEGKTLDVEELRPYLSPGNILTVRYVYDGTGSQNEIQLPMPMVAGREK